MHFHVEDFVTSPCLIAGTALVGASVSGLNAAERQHLVARLGEVVGVLAGQRLSVLVPHDGRRRHRVEDLAEHIQALVEVDRQQGDGGGIPDLRLDCGRGRRKKSWQVE